MLHTVLFLYNVTEASMSQLKDPFDPYSSVAETFLALPACNDFLKDMNVSLELYLACS